MKAINALKAVLTNEYNLEAFGLFTYYDDFNLYEFFGYGTTSYGSDKFKDETVYLYMYRYTDEPLDFAGQEPDIIYMTEDGCEIGLFEIR